MMMQPCMNNYPNHMFAGFIWKGCRASKHTTQGVTFHNVLHSLQKCPILWAEGVCGNAFLSLELHNSIIFTRHLSVNGWHV